MAKKKGPTPKKKAAPAELPSGIGVAYAPPRRFDFNPNHEVVQKIASELPPGLLAVVANESARYTVFMGNIMATVMPYGSRFAIHTGCYVVDSCNRAFNGVSEQEDWVMLMGDDHQWPPEMVLKLVGQMYEHDLDIIVPTCFRRSFPPAPVLYEYQTIEGQPDLEKYAWDADSGRALFPIDLNAYPEGGLVEVDAAGSAGMVVRKRVLTEMEPPWFRIGVGQWGEDLDFCRRAQNHGFRIWADLDMPLGHILNATIWPVRSVKGEWQVEYDYNSQGGFRLAL